jgi:hypothetical protein
MRHLKTERERTEDKRNLAFAAVGTILAGLATAATVGVVQAAELRAQADEAKAEDLRIWEVSDHADLGYLAEQVEGTVCAADLEEDAQKDQGGPVITVIDLGDPAFGETADFSVSLASDGAEHECEFLFVNGRDQEIRVDHPAWKIQFEEGRHRLVRRLTKTFHLTQFPPTAHNTNRFVLYCDGEVADQVEFHLYAP